MSFIDKAENGIQAGMNVASNALDESLIMGDLKTLEQKMRSLLSSLEDQKNKMLMKIGTELYEHSETIDDYEEYFSEEFSQLGVLTPRIEQLKRSLGIMRSKAGRIYLQAYSEGLRCPCCNGPITILDEACISCGQEIAEYADAMTVCSSCGRIYDSEAMFCEVCGVKLSPADIKQFNAYKSRYVSMQNELVSNQCPNCGAPLVKGAAFCGKCGNPL